MVAVGTHLKLIPEEIKRFIANKNIITNIFSIQAYNSIMCGYFCNEFVDFMLKGKSLTDFTNLLPPYNFENNDKVILDHVLK